MSTELIDVVPQRPIRALLTRAARVSVPRGEALNFLTLSGIVVFLLLNEAITGVLLALYFRPATNDANASVRFIITDVEFGGLVRSLHYWGAQSLIVVLGAMLAWAALHRSYRSPNGVAWISAVALTVLVVGETITGGLLPWSHRSVIESQITSTVVGQIPLVGPWIRGLMLGGNAPGDLALVRILGVHAGALPMLLTFCAVVLALHTAGVSPRNHTASTVPLAPDALLRAGVAAAVAAMVLFVLASFVPPPLGTTAEAIRATAVGVKPSWYLVFADQALRLAPARMLGIPSAKVIVSIGSVCVAGLAILPALDRRASRPGQVAILIVMAAIVGGTIRALLA